MALLPTAVSGMQTITAQLITAKYTGRVGSSAGWELSGGSANRVSEGALTSLDGLQSYL